MSPSPSVLCLTCTATAQRSHTVPGHTVLPMPRAQTLTNLLPNPPRTISSVVYAITRCTPSYSCSLRLGPLASDEVPPVRPTTCPITCHPVAPHLTESGFWLLVAASAGRLSSTSSIVRQGAPHAVRRDGSGSGSGACTWLGDAGCN